MAPRSVQCRFSLCSGNSCPRTLCLDAIARRHRLATGAQLCKGRVLAFYHSGMVPGGALLLSVYLHTGAGLIQENWQILSTIGQWLLSQALPFIIGADFQVEPKQLDSGWVRAVGGFVVSPQLATVTPSHRVIDFFVVSETSQARCEAATPLSHHIAPHRPVRILVSTWFIQPKQR